MNENTGISTNVWGSSEWVFLHSIALIYNPDTDKEKYFNFFTNLGSMLPCFECQLHYQENVNKQELMDALDSNEIFFKYVYDLHNKVNKQSGIPESKWPSYESIKKRYESYRVNCSSSPGVCSSNTAPKIKMVEQFGNYSDEQWPYVVTTGIFASLFIIAILYILYLKNPRLRR